MESTSPNPRVSDDIVNYRVPAPSGDAEDKALLKWVRNMLKEGYTFIASQRAFPHIDKSIDLVYEGNASRLPEAMCDINLNQLKSDISKVVATFSNIRATSDYTTQAGEEFEGQTNVLNRCYLDWYLRELADRRVKAGLQKAGVEGTGYLSAVWDSQKKRIKLRIYGAKQVLPIQPDDEMEPQSCYGVILVNETPLARAHAQYPHLQTRMIPDRAAPTFVKRAIRKAKRVGSIVLGMFGKDGELQDATTTYPTVDIFHIYVQDDSINDTGLDVLMGDPDSNWSYSVHSLHSLNSESGQLEITQIPTGEYENGKAKKRPVTRPECKLYPRGRLIVATRNLILDDGPNPYLHGEVPCIPVTFDKWEGQWLGFPLTMGLAENQKTANQLIRDMADSSRASLNPPFSMDENLTTDGQAMKILPRQPGQRWKANHLLGDAIKFPFPPEYYQIQSATPLLVEFLLRKQKELLGVVDAEALTQFRQAPGNDSIQSILEAMGPLVMDRARGVEASIVRMGFQVAGLIFQFYDAPRRLRIMGIDGITPQDYEFTPGSLAPATIKGKTEGERLAIHIKSFSYSVSPNSLHEITSMTRRLLLLQLQRSGFPIDPWTLAEINNIPNFGPTPEGTKNMYERWKFFQTEQAKFAAELQQMMQPPSPLGIEGGNSNGNGNGNGGNPISNLPPQVQAVLQMLLAAGQQGNGGNQGVGAKPSGHSAPHLVNKGDRSTIAES